MNKISNKKNRLYYPYDKYANKINQIIDKAEGIRSTDIKKFDKDNFINNKANNVIIDCINKLIDGEDVKVNVRSLKNKLDKIVVSKINEIAHPDKSYGAKYVDLGLPSGTLWASCNLGATKPWEYGDYYMWGSVTPNTNDVCDMEHTPFHEGSLSNNGWTKYNGKEIYGTVVDNKTILDSEDDAVYVATNGDARMPTYEQFRELIDNTTSEFVNNYKGSGVCGRKFIAPNGNNIFIPTSGYRKDSSFEKRGETAFLWSSIIVLGLGSSLAMRFQSSNNIAGINLTHRNLGCCLRGVKSK